MCTFDYSRPKRLKCGKEVSHCSCVRLKCGSRGSSAVQKYRTTLFASVDHHTEVCFLGQAMLCVALRGTRKKKRRNQFSQLLLQGRARRPKFTSVCQNSDNKTSFHYFACNVVSDDLSLQMYAQTHVTKPVCTTFWKGGFRRLMCTFDHSRPSPLSRER